MVSTHSPGAYRSDIDGLRAVAVISVILFHAGIASVSGGFVGVDVFFVISGYLITKILLDDTSIVRFYQRRARRIIPALSVVLVVVLGAGLLLFLPHDLVDLSRSVEATLLFFSNILFWRKAGYFATETELWPLLHTWSLGVEEQFYIFFPLFVRLFAFLRRPYFIALMVLVAVVSLWSAAFSISHLKPVIAFYMAPTRAWELLVGSILVSARVPAAKSYAARSAIALAGLAGIIIPVLLYTPETSFPGLTALPPVIGCALLLYAGEGGGHLLSRPLGWGPVRGVGLISYSLYLWHWPVLAFARYVAVRPLVPLETAGAVLLAFVLAIVSWRYVERPFRRGFSDRTIWLLSLAVSLAILGAAALVVSARGLPARFPAKIVALNEASGETWRCPVTSFISFGSFYACPIDLPSGRVADADVVLWGDSHAQMYVPALRAALGDRHAILVNANGCAPVAEDAATPDCGAIQRANYAMIRALPAKTVILAQNWPQYRDEAGARLGRDPLPEERYQDALKRLRTLVGGLRAAGKRVVLIGPVPLPGYDLASVTSRDLLFHGEIKTPVAVTRQSYLLEETNILNVMDNLARDPQVRIIRVDQKACDRATCSYIIDGQAIFADYGHYTTAFSGSLAPLFRESIDGR
ncbi:MAG: acyltransferase [Bradyrhizobium sp.]|nr:acyltransferase [Bradyrhizobium sp.]